MSKKTKNCKKKCCCCCCKPKPPTPNLCQTLLYQFTIPKQTNTLSLENGALTINNSFLLQPSISTAQEFLNRYFISATKDGYKSLYTFNITLNYFIRTEYVYGFENSKKPIYLEEYIYIMGQKTLVSQKNRSTPCSGFCQISDTNTTQPPDSLLTITPDSSISNIEFLINENNNNAGGGKKNTLEYNLTEALINVGMFLVPLTLKTLFEVVKKDVQTSVKQTIVLYDSIRTQQITEKKINSSNNNGFYYISNNDTFNILTTTYDVKYSFTGQLIFNIDTKSVVKFTLTIYALIDTNPTIIGTKEFSNTGDTTKLFPVSVDLVNNQIILDKKTTHTIKLYWEITSGNGQTYIFNIVNTNRSYFNLIVDNTGICNI